MPFFSEGGRVAMRLASAFLHAEKHGFRADHAPLGIELRRVGAELVDEGGVGELLVSARR